MPGARAETSRAGVNYGVAPPWSRGAPRARARRRLLASLGMALACRARSMQPQCSRTRVALKACSNSLSLAEKHRDTGAVALDVRSVIRRTVGGSEEL